MHRFTLIILLLACCFPQLALAHTVEGIGKFYGGMLHSLLVPAHALALLTFSLLVGQRGVRGMQYSYPSFLFMLAVGLIFAGFDIELNRYSEVALLCLAACFGLIAAISWKLPLFLYTALGTLLGLLIGADSGVTDFNRRETALALLGCWIGDAVILILLAGVVELLRKAWQRIAIRVLGSWGAASAVLVLAMQFR